MDTFVFLPIWLGHEMTVNPLLWLLILPALSFALLYFPMVTKFSLSLASPYAKADVKRRLLAGSLDGSLLVTSLYFYQNSGSAWFVVAGAVYVLLRDAIQGRSVGKFFVGLMVISLETGRPCTFVGSVRRNLVFLFPGVNVVAVFLEPITIVRDPLGHRLGDRLAGTQVVVGFGARDLAASFVQWFQPTARPLRHRVQPIPAPGLFDKGVPSGSQAAEARSPHPPRAPGNETLTATRSTRPRP